MTISTRTDRHIRAPAADGALSLISRPDPVREEAWPTDRPHHRTILAVDIEDSTARTNPIKARLRRAMYDLLERSLHTAGVAEQHHDPLVDRGDGILALIRPVDQAPKTLLLDTVIPNLAWLLALNNDNQPDQRFRLRTVVHAGEIHYDERGCFGEALDVAFRLLDAPEVKQALRIAKGPLTLVVSDDIYRSVVRHNYAGIDGHVFEPFVLLRTGDRQHCGWVHAFEPISAENRPRQVTGSLIRLDDRKRPLRKPAQLSATEGEQGR